MPGIEFALELAEVVVVYTGVATGPAGPAVGEQVEVDMLRQWR